MKILLAADGSDYTRRAAKQIATHLDWFAEKPVVFLLNVHAPMPLNRASAIVGKAAVDSYMRDECLEALAVAEGELRSAGLEFQSAWVAGDVAEELTRFAADNAIDLIVMGSHGHGALANLALGSNATRIIAATKVPVLIVR